MKKYRFSAAVLAAVIAMSSGAVQSYASSALKGYFDCNDHWAKKEIDFVTSYGVAGGKGGNLFAPDDTITRAELVSMTVRALGLAETPYKGAYSDVDANAWYADCLQAASDAGLINEAITQGGAFEGDKPITREEIASVAVAGLEILTQAPLRRGDISGFSDLSEAGEWAKEALSFAVGMGIITGNTDGKIQPVANATRAEAAVMLYRMLDYRGGGMLVETFDKNNPDWKFALRRGEETLNRKNPQGKVYHTEDDGNNAPGCMVFDLDYSGYKYVNSWQFKPQVFNDTENVIEEGKIYHLSFYAKVEGVDELVVNQVFLGNPDDQNDRYTDQVPTIIRGDEWDHYHLYITSNKTMPAARLYFWGGGETLKYKVYFDDFRLEELDACVPVGVYTDEEFQGLCKISPGGTFTSGTVVPVSASSPADSGLLFAGWRDAYGNSASQNSSDTVDALGNVLMKAEFKPYKIKDYGYENAASADAFSVEVKTEKRENGEIPVTVKPYIPSGYKLLECGAVSYDLDFDAGLNVFTDGAKISTAETLDENGAFDTKVHTEKINLDTSVRGYAISADSEGNVYVAYSDIAVVSGEETRKAREYKMMYNHELLEAYVQHDYHGIEFPWQNNWKTAYDWYAEFVRDIDNTDVDLFAFCPQLWRTLGWPSKVDTSGTDPLPPSVKQTISTVERHRAALAAGVDPTALTLKACKAYGVDALASFRMNDCHHLDKVDWISHNNLWRDNPDYWFEDSSSHVTKRMFNYMIPEVRDYYYSIIEEFITTYDVVGIELDFHRELRYFYDDEVEKGKPVMTEFVAKIRNLLDRVGEAQGKRMLLSVRMPRTVELCEAEGLDVTEWDRLGYIDIINVTSSNAFSLEYDIEGFKEKLPHTKVFGEITWRTYEASNEGIYATPESWYAAVQDYLYRGADGISLFNVGWIQIDKKNILGALNGIMDEEERSKKEKHYVMSTVSHKDGTSSKYFPAKTEVDFDMHISDNTQSGIFKKALLLVEMEKDCTNENIDVYVNGSKLTQLSKPQVYLFEPASPDASYTRNPERYKMYTVSLDTLKQGWNDIEIKVTSQDEAGRILGAELGLYKN